MTKPVLHDLSQEEPTGAPGVRRSAPPDDDPSPAAAEMARVLGAQPFGVPSDCFGGDAGAPAATAPVRGGLAPNTLLRTIERLRSDSDADVSLAALASGAGLSRFHFCRAFKESTGLSPHAWLRQHRLEQAMNMLRDTEAPVVSVAAELGYASQTAFAAAFKRMTGETPSEWRRRRR